MRWYGHATVARVAVTAATVVCSAVGAAQAPADPYAVCQEQFRRAPRDYESAYCFYRVTFERRLWAEGARIFDDLIAEHPDNSWLVLAYGHIHRSRDPDRAEVLYRRAARAFQAAGDVAGEAEARTNLANFLRPKGRVEDARREVDRVVALAASVGDPLVRAQAWILESAYVQETGGDLGVSYRLLKQAQDILPEHPPYLRERALLIALGAASFRMGRLDEALTTYRRLETLAMAKGEPLVLANARYNIFNTAEAMEAVLPTPGARDRLTAMAERSLATAVAGQNLDVTVKSHRALADLMAFDDRAHGEALRHAQQCITLAAEARQPADEAACSWIVATLEAPADARAARAAGQRAVEATSRDNNPRTQAHSAGRQMRVSWLTRSHDEAIRDSLAAIGTVETLRALQDDARTSADLFSSWTRDYYWLSGRLLREDHPDVALAFSVTERMRARSLLDVLDTSRQPLDPGHPAVAARRAVLESIAAVQRVLMDGSVGGERRARHLQELDVLERREQEARRQVAMAFPDRRDVPRTFASLDAVQAALGPDEALLSFQVGLWESYAGEDEGGSWLLVATRDSRTIYRLPDRARLAPAVPMFNGLLESSQRGAAAAAISLYDALLSDAVSSLPPGINRLVIVPDGVLHHLPFEALQSSREAPPLAARYEIVLAPSATLWLQGRARPRRTPTGRMLVLADPALAGSAERADRGSRIGDRGSPIADPSPLRGVRLGRLPHARDESSAIAHHVAGVDVLIGEKASERNVKARDLRTYDVLHFAAHAVADEAHPERSAVLLAAGGPAEDGLLQAREIAALDIEESIVVLSACQTAAGAVLSGEGVLSLARAFFEGGAHAVIGTRWPLRDADAAVLFDTFYRHLAEGVSLSAALKATRDEARAAGRPPSAWASLVLLGNGDLRPFAGRRPPVVEKGRHLAPLVVALSILIALGIVLARRRA
ncbi:putative ATPase [Luteitalea pratensis]|uniref:Putative ATPase n=1 Tax=Luteitalea pratensis TaxID=1855912 RepID=A0A143PKL9_LUTPR|nr:CHAT domain-containing protein [Luteitalea pratensis]AMY09087.1 putative ATPase [Luteitalea pratensis]